MTDAILSWGLELIRSVQEAASPFLTALMKALTLAGSEYFYLLVLPVLFWCVDERFGLRFGLVILFSTWANSAIKSAVALGRPYSVDPSVGLSHESSYSFPSNHAQGSAVFWGLLAQRIRRPWGILLAVVLPLAIGFTRVYLGVHYPSDVVVGWLLGWSFAILWLTLGKRFETWLGKAHRRVKIILIALATLGMNALAMRDTNVTGVFFGTALGYVFMVDLARFDAGSGNWIKKLARFALGAAALGLIYFGGKLVSPAEGHELYALARFVRYALVGAWVSLGAPWLFVRLKLATLRA